MRKWNGMQLIWSAVWCVLCVFCAVLLYLPLPNNREGRYYMVAACFALSIWFSKLVSNQVSSEYYCITVRNNQRCSVCSWNGLNRNNNRTIMYVVSFEAAHTRTHNTHNSHIYALILAQTDRYIFPMSCGFHTHGVFSNLQHLSSCFLFSWRLLLSLLPFYRFAAPASDSNVIIVSVSVINNRCFRLSIRQITLVFRAH